MKNKNKKQTKIPHWRIPRSLVLCVMLCISLFVLLSFIFWPLCCLYFFDLRILITHLISSNSSWLYICILPVLTVSVTSVSMSIRLSKSVEVKTYCWSEAIHCNSLKYVFPIPIANTLIPSLWSLLAWCVVSVLCDYAPSVRTIRILSICSRIPAILVKAWLPAHSNARCVFVPPPSYDKLFIALSKSGRWW